ncbi:hypothetical protein VOLCADRAFT_100799 [Volvox carteri f. nagariensis]|uniref:Uncharacterized protein n=1 Tax=Volvox carteri f. nagariensis TaxID=3068 RepID=D8UL23_VOLCA|nr:uncharacterized protein VOLCADRAFT_100799 [Volvox carteri f. nagariensis]EFJ39574.1 hypothetical protein VOLCADRAFT_100799 [Volvox carteri f. nagariensis]|eukprot:XP_002959358.1 hypothetical protein VOLCADRAFT_100799 [Volvox carteri f. nagariensis]
MPPFSMWSGAAVSTLSAFSQTSPPAPPTTPVQPTAPLSGGGGGGGGGANNNSFQHVVGRRQRRRQLPYSRQLPCRAAAAGAAAGANNSNNNNNNNNNNDNSNNSIRNHAAAAALNAGGGGVEPSYTPDSSTPRSGSVGNAQVSYSSAGGAATGGTAAVAAAAGGGGDDLYSFETTGSGRSAMEYQAMTSALPPPPPSPPPTATSVPAGSEGIAGFTAHADDNTIRQGGGGSRLNGCVMERMVSERDAVMSGKPSQRGCLCLLGFDSASARIWARRPQRQRRREAAEAKARRRALPLAAATEATEMMKATEAVAAPKRKWSRSVSQFDSQSQLQLPQQQERTRGSFLLQPNTLVSSSVASSAATSAVVVTIGTNVPSSGVNYGLQSQQPPPPPPPPSRASLAAALAHTGDGSLSATSWLQPPPPVPQQQRPEQQQMLTQQLSESYGSESAVSTLQNMYGGSTGLRPQLQAGTWEVAKSPKRLTAGGDGTSSLYGGTRVATAAAPSAADRATGALQGGGGSRLNGCVMERMVSERDAVMSGKPSQRGCLLDFDPASARIWARRPQRQRRREAAEAKARRRALPLAAATEATEMMKATEAVAAPKRKWSRVLKLPPAAGAAAAAAAAAIASAAATAPTTPASAFRSGNQSGRSLGDAGKGNKFREKYGTMAAAMGLRTAPDRSSRPAQTAPATLRAQMRAAAVLAAAAAATPALACCQPSSREARVASAATALRRRDFGSYGSGGGGGGLASGGSFSEGAFASGMIVLGGSGDSAEGSKLPPVSEIPMPYSMLGTYGSGVGSMRGRLRQRGGIPGFPIRDRFPMAAPAAAAAGIEGGAETMEVNSGAPVGRTADRRMGRAAAAAAAGAEAALPRPEFTFGEPRSLCSRRRSSMAVVGGGAFTPVGSVRPAAIRTLTIC